MKSHRIVDSIDHVTPLALDRGGLKAVQARSILIVVRGMILAHTVPIAIADREVTINQDMKALRFKSAVAPEFALWCLRVQASEILEEIATASHGTKRLDTDRLTERPILLPKPEEQSEFVRRITAWETMRRNMRDELAATDLLFTSLQNRAFRGEL
jgi:type I restriction enzyme S subunit